MVKQTLMENNLDMKVINPEMKKPLHQLREGQQLNRNFCLDNNDNQMNYLKIKNKCSQKMMAE